MRGLIHTCACLLTACLSAISTAASVPQVEVPAGHFVMGCDHERQSELCTKDSLPAHRVYLRGFFIDKYEVTFARYKRCVEAGICTQAFIGGACNWGFDWNDQHPVNCVDWQQAREFCAFEGKRLPTEAEWEKAARGTDRRIFPWGNTAASCKTATMDENGLNKPMAGCGAGKTRPVGSAPEGASPYGAEDMSGNLWEWTADWYDSKYYHHSPTKNPKGPRKGKFKTVRGGAWTMRTDAGLSSTLRFGYSPNGQGYVVGFRCASDH